MMNPNFTVLMVAEKPSIAQAVASALSAPFGASMKKRKGVSPSAPVFEVAGVPFSTLGIQKCTLKVTSTVGHMFSLDFPKEYNNGSVNPVELFEAPTVRMEDPRPRMSEHLASEAHGCDAMVLWLDCDREGENICFEVISVVHGKLNSVELPGVYMGNIWRAHFSSLAPADLAAAFTNLGHPNVNESASVDARQEIDLKLGISFSRFQTKIFRENFGAQLGKHLSVTYGPCQTPTLWFCVHRQDERAAFEPTPFWRFATNINIPDNKSGASLSVCCTSVRGDIFVEADAAAVVSKTKSCAAVVSGLAVSTSVGPRPLPLNTVALMRAASSELGIGPGDAIHLAERLYLAGLVSYPRTETSCYAEGFEVAPVIKALAKCQELNIQESSYLSKLFGPESPSIPRARSDGMDCGATVLPSCFGLGCQ